MAKKGKEKFVWVDAEEIIEFYNMKYHSNAMWLNIDGVWTSLNMFTNEGHKTAYLKTLIKEVYEYKYLEIPKDDREDYKIPPPKMQIDTGTIIGITIRTRKVSTIFKGIVFKNGYVKSDGNGFVETENIPFTTVQIAKDFKKDVKPNAVFVKWFKAITDGDKKIQLKYLTMWSYALSSETLGIMMYSHGPGGRGKSEVVLKIADYAGRENSKKVKSTTVFGRGAAANGRFSLRGINDKSVSYFDEFIKKLADDAGNTLKGMMNTSGYIEYEDKRSNDTDTLNTHSWFATSNNYPKFKDMDPWVEERIVIASFKNVNLPEKELESFMAGEYIDYLVTMLVKAYTRSAKYKGTRNKLLKVDEYQAAWLVSDALKSDEEIWVIEQNRDLDGKPLNEILDQYRRDTNRKTNNTNMGTALKGNGFQVNQNKRPRIYEFVGEIPKGMMN